MQFAYVYKFIRASEKKKCFFLAFFHEAKKNQYYVSFPLIRLNLQLLLFLLR